jgi:hypothetical protein
MAPNLNKTPEKLPSNAVAVDIKLEETTKKSKIPIDINLQIDSNINPNLELFLFDNNLLKFMVLIDVI